MVSKAQTNINNKKIRFVTPSAGNMGQGVAWMAQELNKKKEIKIDEVVVIAPSHVPSAKKDALLRFGAKCLTVPFDTWWTIIDQSNLTLNDETSSYHYLNHPDLKEHFENNQDQWHNIFVHPVFDTLVMAGNGTIGLEIIEDLKEFDSIIIPYGGGALSCGIAVSIRHYLPNCKMYTYIILYWNFY